MASNPDPSSAPPMDPAESVLDLNVMDQLLSLDDGELVVYQKMYSLLMENLPRPDLVIYLQATAETLRKRIKSRNRDYEKQITDAYVEELNQAPGVAAAKFRQPA